VNGLSKLLSRCHEENLFGGNKAKSCRHELFTLGEGVRRNSTPPLTPGYDQKSSGPSVETTFENSGFHDEFQALIVKDVTMPLKDL